MLFHWARTDLDQLLCIRYIGYVELSFRGSFDGLPSSLLLIGTFRSEGEDDYEYEFSVLSMRIRFEARQFSKCACSEQKTGTRS